MPGTAHHGPPPQPGADQSRTAVHPVTRAEIRRFACAIGAANPEHHDVAAARAAGHPDLVAPPYFCTAIGLALGRTVPRAELGPDGSPLADELAGRRIMAGQTAVSWHGDLYAGDEITVTQRLLSAEHKQSRGGPLDVLTYERRYLRNGQLLVREEYVRLAR
jgi:acyl dehydratase